MVLFEGHKKEIVWKHGPPTIVFGFHVEANGVAGASLHTFHEKDGRHGRFLF